MDDGGRPALDEAALSALALLDALPILVVSADAGLVTKINSAAQQMFGVSASNSARQLSIFVDENAFRNFLAEVVSQGRCSSPALLKGAGGRTFWGAVTGARLGLGGDAALLLTINDIDEQHRATEELAAALNHERQITEKQREMLQLAAHEFRTPLAVIDGAAQVLCRRADDLSPDQITALAMRVRKFVSQMTKVLESTIELHGQNLKEAISKRKSASISQLLHEVAEAFTGAVRVTIDQSVEEIPIFPFDADLLAQAIVKLLENSIKYTESNPKVEVSARLQEGRVELFIRDWGLGIPVEERASVFAAYVRGSNVGHKPGSGIGLSVVKQVFAAHDGDVEIVHTDGPGLTIRAWMPLTSASLLMEKEDSIPS